MAHLSLPARRSPSVPCCRHLLGYTVLVVLAGPPLVWALLVVALR